ncbi:hypothetical protein G3A43_07265 [Paraburkholderia aspalathi]|nr:hypothetical protein [Paraburkholderia aspalathi]MBK3780052.1 hypothetical protein [Paraburkholderia aspalathi]
MQNQTVSKKVEDLVAGNLVDLEACPFLSKHPSAATEYGYVNSVNRETADCVVVAYEGIDHIGYPLGTELQVRLPRDVPDPVVRVQLVSEGGQWVDWNLSQNLTDRWGDLNYHNEENKPLELLTNDAALLERLVEQMWSEGTFVVRKDGKFALLFEAEYCSRESEESEKDSDPETFAKLKPHDEAVAILLAAMKPLLEKFPGVLFAVPDAGEVINDRPAAWAFVPDGHLTQEQREELGTALSTL